MSLPEFQVSQPEPPDQPPQDEIENKNATAFSAPQQFIEESVPLEQITTAELPDKVCTQCLEDNLIKKGIIETFTPCQKCGEEFCIHGVSKLDPQYCIHCCNDFKIVDVIEQEQRPIFNKDGALIAVRQFKVRHITLSGLHWLFFNRAITNLSDIELEHAIEYHQSIYHGMIYEREARRVQKAHRNKGKVAGNENHSITQNPFESTQDGVRFVTGTGTPTQKKVRTRTVKVSQSSTGIAGTKKGLSPEALQALVAELMKAGLSQEQILAIGKK